MTARWSGNRSVCAVLAVVVASATWMPLQGQTEQVRAIVRTAEGAMGSVARAIERVGGTVVRAIPLIDSLVADVPAAAVGRVARARGVLGWSPDAAIRFESLTGTDPNVATSSTPVTSVYKDPNSLYRLVTEVLDVDTVWAKGFTGAGVDVAMIDTGVVPVDGLTYAGKVINGPDLSFESMHPQARYLDTYGHGTHLAGIIAGRDKAATKIAPSTTRFLGIAPGARIVNVKVADHTGATDVSQVLAGIDWVVRHRKDNGMNIRVLNLSFGTDGIQPYLTDPLTYAVEKAWKAGIVVVVAAGNGSFGDDSLNNPAYDPYVLAVGAASTVGTRATTDDDVPSWSATGNHLRNPDLVAPGRSVISLRSPGSLVDEENPSARIAGRFFRGSGTSQAAAVVSGAVALVLHQRPTMTPDQVKALLRSSARAIPAESARDQGAGLIDPPGARAAKTPSALLSTQAHPPGTGLGSLDAARGTLRVAEDGIALAGEQDIFGLGWSLAPLTTAVPTHLLWQGDWTGTSWAGRSWAGAAWTGRSWSGRSWSGRSWSGRSWSGTSWSGGSWSGRSWSSDAWSSAAWGDA